MIRFPENGRSALPDNKRTLVFLIICLCLVFGAHVGQQYKPYTFADYDPGWAVSTVMSLADDHDLDLRNQLHNDPSQAADQTAQGRNGEWYPLHEILMPLLTVPFYLALGINGCLVFNVLISVLLFLLVFRLCRRHADRQSAFTATVLTAFPTLFLNYTYSYSQDVFSTFLLVLAFWFAVERGFLFTGFVWGLAVCARLANAVTAVGFLLYLLLVPHPCGDSQEKRHWIRGRRTRALLMTFAGGVLPILCIFLTNWLMFGSPTTSSYDRWQHFVDGRAVVSSQRGALSCSSLERLSSVLLQPKSGLVTGAPLLILAVAFGMRPYWHRCRHEALLFIVTCCSLIALFSKYCNAMPGAPGNRYLMPVVALSAIPLAHAIEECFYGRDSGAKQDG